MGEVEPRAGADLEDEAGGRVDYFVAPAADDSSLGRPHDQVIQPREARRNHDPPIDVTTLTSVAE